MKQLNRKKVCVVLFSLAGALAIAAAAIFLMLWDAGVKAQQKAQALLNASGITSYTTITPHESAAADASAALISELEPADASASLK